MRLYELGASYIVVQINTLALPRTSYISYSYNTRVYSMYSLIYLIVLVYLMPSMVYRVYGREDHFYVHYSTQNHKHLRTPAAKYVN